MAFSLLKSAIETPRAGLAALASAGLACGLAVLALLPVGGNTTAPSIGAANATLLATLAAGAAVMGFVALRSRRELIASREKLAACELDLAGARKALRFAQMASPAQDEAQLYWETDQSPRMLSTTLDPRHGVPAEAGALLQTSNWLAPAPAQQLNAAIGRLTEEGKPFALAVTTNNGGALEVTGQIRGTSAVLRIADQSVQRKAIRDLEDRCTRIARDAQITRGLFEALPAFQQFDLPGTDIFAAVAIDGSHIG